MLNLKEPHKNASAQAFELMAITADWLPDDAKFEAYTNGLRWNGWVMPFFSEKAAHSLLPYMPELRYDGDRDAFIAKANSPGDDDEVFVAATLQLGSEVIKTYPIGAGCWCWEYCE